MHVGARILRECECVYINVMCICVRTQLFLSFFWLHIWMKCTLTYTISSCHAITSPSVMANKQWEGTHWGRRAFFFFFDTALQRRSATWRSGGVPEQDFSLSSVQHRCDAMDTRPPLVKPRCPCFIRHPTGSPALLISVFRQLAPRPSSIGRWPPVLKESSSLQILP